MAHSNDYNFNSLSRIGDDSCDISQRNVQNVSQANYLLTNYFSADCGMQRPIEFATSQPNIFYKGGNQVGAGGCNIDANSELLIGTINTELNYWLKVPHGVILQQLNHIIQRLIMYHSILL